MMSQVSFLARHRDRKNPTLYYSTDRYKQYEIHETNRKLFLFVQKTIIKFGTNFGPTKNIKCAKVLKIGKNLSLKIEWHNSEGHFLSIKVKPKIKQERLQPVRMTEVPSFKFSLNLLIVLSVIVDLFYNYRKFMI